MNRTIQIDNLRDLEQFGIIALTGEACGYSMRTLCDLTREGEKLIEEFLGMQVTGANWNSSTKGVDHVSSFMMPRGLFEDLAKYSIYRLGYKYICIQSHGNMTGFGVNGEVDTKHTLEYLNWAKNTADHEDGALYFNPLKVSQPMENGRCVHQATGRVE